MYTVSINVSILESKHFPKRVTKAEIEEWIKQQGERGGCVVSDSNVIYEGEDAAEAERYYKQLCNSSDYVYARLYKNSDGCMVVCWAEMYDDDTFETRSAFPAWGWSEIKKTNTFSVPKFVEEA